MSARGLGRALFVLEGGYNPASLARCVIETIRGFEEGMEVDRADEAAIPCRQRAILDGLSANLNEGKAIWYRTA
jgi:acetoin utilization deacetylase AcuC-like enzyme